MAISYQRVIFEWLKPQNTWSYVYNDVIGCRVPDGSQSLGSAEAMKTTELIISLITVHNFEYEQTNLKHTLNLL